MASKLATPLAGTEILKLAAVVRGANSLAIAWEAEEGVISWGDGENLKAFKGAEIARDDFEHAVFEIGKIERREGVGRDEHVRVSKVFGRCYWGAATGLKVTPNLSYGRSYFEIP